MCAACLWTKRDIRAPPHFLPQTSKSLKCRDNSITQLDNDGFVRQHQTTKVATPQVQGRHFADPVFSPGPEQTREDQAQIPRHLMARLRPHSRYRRAHNSDI